MSNASSNQLVVHDGVDYEEVYMSDHRDQESPSEERSPSTSSSSSTNKDMEMANQEEVSDNGEDQMLGFRLPWDSMVIKCVSQVFSI